ncbi:restriction endonuclease subunit S [Kingella potus]|uniref:restriction endonuclease subunit S n=1 Tax=Kingella potus TaxID=265175 RepID=UPI001FD29F66|nr:restriction endonuclease subunit S [Kingella potus]UOP01772.1 restriction endonuclease subunit S [Kingella potus]
MSGQDSKHAPRLRFHGFAGEWDSQKLSEVLEPLKSYPLSRNVETKEITGFKYIHYGDIHKGVASVLDNLGTLSYIKKGEFDLLKYGDLVVADASEDYSGIATPTVVNCIPEEKLVAGLHTIALRPTNSCHLFLYYLLYTDNFKKYGKVVGVGTKVFGISTKNLLAFETKLPTLPEQTAIGNFFRQLDHRIAESRTRLEKNRQLKKAMLAKMFPAHGDTAPKLRFQGFTGEWERKKIGELGEVITGNTPPTSENDNYENDGLLWVTPTDIKEPITTKTAKQLSEKGKKTARLLPPNSILVTCIASIGKNTLIETWGSCNQQINALIPKKDFNPYFLLTLSEFWSVQMKKIAGSGTMDIVNKTQFSDIDVLIPAEPEQTAIGNFFRQLDDTIALQALECEKLGTA